MEFLSQWWDVLTFLFFAIILTLVNIHLWRTRKSDTSLHDLPQKQFGATTLTGASSTAISVVSILISASLVYIQLEQNSSAQARHEVLDHAFRVIIWFLISLLMGLFLLWRHGIYGQFKNIITNLYVTIPFGFQFLAIAVGAGHVIIGIYALIYK